MKELLKSFLSFGLATTLEKILLFLFIPIYSHYLQKDEMGVIDMLQVATEAASILALLQLETAFQRYYLDYRNALKRTFITSNFIFIFAFSLVIAAIGILFTKQIGNLLFHTQAYNKALVWSFLKMPLYNFSIFVFIMLRFEKKNKLFLAFVLLRVLSLLLLTILALFTFKDPVFAIIWAQVISMLITCVLLFFFLKNYLNVSFAKKLIRRSLSFSLPMLPARLGSFTVTYANRFFLISLLSLSSIGIYSLSLRFASAVQIIYTAFMMAWPPFLFATVKKEGAKDVFKNILPVTACLVFFIVCSITIFSNEVITYFSTPTYAESGKYIGGLSLFFCLLIFKEIVDIGPKVKEKTRYITYTFFVSAAINIISLIALTGQLGIPGVVLSMIITNTCLLIMSWIISNRLYHVPFNIIKFILYALPAYFISCFFLFYVPSLGARLLILGGVIVFYATNFAFVLKKINTNKAYI